MNLIANYKEGYSKTAGCCSLNCNCCCSRNENIKKENQPVKTDEKPDVFEVFSKKVINKKDLIDMVTIPRNIFKGYLCFTAGTAFSAISGLIKKDKISKVLLIFGNLMSIYGTFNFVKPYLIKNKELTKIEK